MKTKAEIKQDRIAWLRANVARCEEFIAQGEASDPIGYRQFRLRKAEFEQQLQKELANPE